MLPENIRSLSPEQKIGQLFCIGIPGTQLDDEVRKLLETVPAGGFCLFSRNIREALQTRRLLEEIRDFLPVEPILSLDQEGGLVDRLRRIVTPMAPASLMQTPPNIKKLAELTAQILLNLGFNTNFAPVVDIPLKDNENLQNGLQSRYLADSAEDVSQLAEIYLKTLQAHGILGCPKHFPGIGAALTDPHEELPIVRSSEEFLEKHDLLPYRNILAESYQVMIAHAAYPDLDLQERDRNGKLLPSSLSYNIVTKLLRLKLGFNGLVVTDDLEMGAILNNYGIGEACVMALEAGVDMLLICASLTSVKTGFEAVRAAVQNGRIAEERITESLQRIAFYKSKMHAPLELNPNQLNDLSEDIRILNENVKQ